MTRTVPEALVDAAAASGRYVFAAEDGAERTETHAELCAAARALGGALLARGLAPGDRVAVIVPDADGFLRAFFGCSLAGLVPAPLAYPGHGGDLSAWGDTIVTLVRAAGVAGIVTSARLLPALDAVRAQAPAVALVAAWDALDGPPLADVHAPRADDVALLQFTSGSVAAPKGVMLTHANIAANVGAIAGPAGLGVVSGRDVGVSWLPLFHDMGLIGLVLVPLYCRTTGVILSPAAFLKRPLTWLAAITRHRGTVSFAPNFAYETCVRRVKDADVDALDLSTWRVAGCGAEPVQADTLAAFTRKFARAGFRAESFVAAYGLAESTLAVTLSPRDRAPRVDRVDAETLAADGVATPARSSAETLAIVACGPPFPGHALEIVDRAGRAVGERIVGEVVVSGPSVMRGYLSGPDDTLRDGRLFTGDLGYLADGELHVCGRRRELIVVRGRNYFPQDLEAVAGRVAGVRAGRVAAFAVTAPGRPDRVVLVAESDESLAPDALEATLRARVLEATGLVIDEVLVRPRGTIDRTTSGKVRRARLREQYEAGMTLGPRRPGRLALARDDA